MKKETLRVMLSAMIGILLFLYFYLYGYQHIIESESFLYVITGTIPQIGGAIILLRLINTKLR